MAGNPLVPNISGNQLDVSALLANPSRLNGLIAKLTADRCIFGEFFTASPNVVTGGGLVYDVLTSGGNFLARDVERRSQGAEYVISYHEPKKDLATPQDWGAKVQLLDEEWSRYDATTLKNRLTALANTIARKIDTLAVASIDAALTKYSIAGVPGSDWSALVTVGDPTKITPNSGRPTADLANAALLVDAEDTGLGTPDTLLCNPAQLAALRIGYGSELPDVLAAVGITNVRSSLRIPAGTAYTTISGAAGVVAFEATPTNPDRGGLVTEVIPDRQIRSTWIQSYAVPAFGVTTPGVVRKLTGLKK